MVFDSIDFRKTMKNIIERHYKKYPNLRIHKEIENMSFLEEK